MEAIKRGTVRSDADNGFILMAAAVGAMPSTQGYVYDLKFYQGAESIRKAEILANGMNSKALGQMLVKAVKDSNARMEQGGRACLPCWATKSQL